MVNPDSYCHNISPNLHVTLHIGFIEKKSISSIFQCVNFYGLEPQENQFFQTLKILVFGLFL